MRSNNCAPRRAPPARCRSPIISARETSPSPALKPLVMKTIRLAVAGAFHTDIMRPADQTLAAALEKTTLQPAKFPVWSNVDAKPHTDPAEIRSLLVRQVLQPVQWEATMRSLLAHGVEKFYEIGPQRVL